MRKSFTSTAIFLVAGGMLLGNLQAQQSPAPKAKPTPAAKARRAPATKTGQAPAKATMELKTQKEKASYAVGVNIGRTMLKDSADIDANFLAQGLKDAVAGGKLLLTDEEMAAALGTLQGELEAKQAAKIQESKKAGEAYLAANKAKPGVVTLPSGLQYRVLTEGTGPKPTATDTVVCNYKGTLTDGTEFDSSYKRGEPASFPVNRVIKGWTEALQLMPVGSKWELVIPSELAYGERGAGGGAIGPNETLVFEVELISIQGKEQGAK